MQKYIKATILFSKRLGEKEGVSSKLVFWKWLTNVLFNFSYFKSNMNNFSNNFFDVAI
jgi:hypothetical protein